MNQIDLTSQNKDYALYLPALGTFFSSFIGKQRFDPMNVDPKRFPQSLTDMEQLNWLNPQEGLFPYKWSLYSAGHADLDLSKTVPAEDMVRNRDPNSFILGDSGGFQIGKGLWPGDWKANSGCPNADKKREQVLKWMDTYMDYGMCLDVPAWVASTEEGRNATGINTYEEAVLATEFNNNYFIQNRTGKCKFLNVLQGGNHTESDDWYQRMKKYSDPNVYPDTHFNGWAFGGQNMSDIHLILKRLVALKFDNLLQEGKHDLIHFLGTSKLEWAVLLTVLQRSLRKHVNPKLTISFDCASPFFGAARGQVYYQNTFPHDGRWSYKMGGCPSDIKYSTDNRLWGDVMIQDGIYKTWEDSPISHTLKMSDICVRKPGEVNKHGKPYATGWDSFSYVLLQAHNVYKHITAVQEANRRYDAGEFPSGMRRSNGDYVRFDDVVEAIFSAPTRDEAAAIVEKYDTYWMEIIGGRGFRGKKTKNSHTMFNALFETVESNEPDSDEEYEDSDDEMAKTLANE